MTHSDVQVRIRCRKCSIQTLVCQGNKCFFRVFYKERDHQSANGIPVGGELTSIFKRQNLSIVSICWHRYCHLLSILERQSPGCTSFCLGFTDSKSDVEFSTSRGMRNVDNCRCIITTRRLLEGIGKRSYRQKTVCRFFLQGFEKNG